MGRAGLLLGTVLLVAACRVVEPTGEAPVAEPAAEAAETGAPQAGSDVKPEMDVLDRVEDSCGLDAFKPYLGKRVLDIPPEIVPDTARILAPDTHVTMDYVPPRVNILTNEEGMIIGLKCG